MSEKELPEGWATVPLDALLEPGGLFDGPFGSNLKTSDYTSTGVRVVRLENLANLRFIEEKRTFISKEKHKTLKKHTVVAGDLLFGSFLDSAVRVAMLPQLDTPAIAKADCFCIRPKTDVVRPRYLMYLLGASQTKDALIEQVHGATRPRVTTRQLRELEVPIAPFPEQERIVEKIDEILARVNTARERLSGVRPLLKHFRQAALAAASSGELTAGWRAAAGQPMSRETGEVDKDALEALFDHRPKTELPEGWRYAAFGSLGAWSSGGTPARSRADFWARGTIPWISPKDMKAPVLDGSQEQITRAAVSASGLTLLPAGALLFVVRGMILAHTFPVCLTSVPATINQDVRSVVPMADLEPKYLLYALRREAMWVLFAVKEATHGTLRLEGVTLRHWPVPVPPKEEQREIVRRVEAFLKLADAIEEHVAAATAGADRLTQAILAKAFRGELVPKEAELARREGRTYEPAAELLRRVLAQGTGDGSPERRHARVRGADRSAQREGSPSFLRRRSIRFE